MLVSVFYIVLWLILPSLVTVLVFINVVPFFLFLCLSVCLYRSIPFCTVLYRDEAALIFPLRLMAMSFWFLFNVGLCFLHFNVAYFAVPCSRSGFD